MTGENLLPVESPVELKEGKLLCSKMAIPAVHEFMELVPQLKSDSGKEAFVEDKTVTLARLDAYLATVVACFSDDDNDKKGGHGHGSTTTQSCRFYQKAHNQLIACFRMCVEQ